VNGSINRISGTGRLKPGIFCALVFYAAVLLTLPTPAQVITLVDQNSLAQINIGTGAGSGGGMTNWTVDGVNQLSQQWFWYRVGGAGPESPINSISAPSFSTPSARSLYVTYNNGSYGVTINYLLTGASFGTRSSDMSESISITNSTASPLTFHFYQYSDFDLAGVSGGDIVQLGKNLRGLYNEATITKTNNSSVSETVLTPGANHGETTNYSATLQKLTDAAPDTLSDINSFGPGDATWAFEWDLTVNPLSSVGISKDKLLHWEPVPEPTALVLFGVAGGSVLLRRNRRQRR